MEISLRKNTNNQGVHRGALYREISVSGGHRDLPTLIWLEKLPLSQPHASLSPTSPRSILIPICILKRVRDHYNNNNNSRSGTGGIVGGARERAALVELHPWRADRFERSLAAS